MEVPQGDTYYFKFTTRAFATGIPTTLAGTPVISVYEENNLTQITSGVSITVDYDSVTGLNEVAVVATSGNGYEVGKYYDAVITTGTVGGVSVVGETVKHFRIMPPEDASAGVKDVNVTHWTDTAVTLSSTTSKPEMDAFSISDDATSADNLELQYDTTGLTGDTFPARQDQLNSFSSGSAAINTTAESFTATTAGTPTNAYTDTATLDGVYHILPPSAGTTDIYYQFDITGDGVPVEARWDGYMQSNGDTYQIYAYNWTGAAWDQIGTRAAANGTTAVTDSWPCTTAHVGTGANLGKVRIRFQSTDGTNIATDRLLLSYTVVQSALGFVGGAVWVDTVNGEAGTGSGIGEISRPSDNIADARTIADANNLRTFHMVPGSSITLAQTFNNFEFRGHGWTLALGGQDVDFSHFFHADVSGIATAANEMEFHHCHVGTASVQKAFFDQCRFTDTVTMTLAGDYTYSKCESGVAGSGSPSFAKTAGQTITAQWRWWSGGASISGLETSDVLTVGGELGTLTLAGSGGSVEVRNQYKTISSGGFSGTVNTDGAIQAKDVADTLADTNELQTDWADGGRLDLILDAVLAMLDDPRAEPGQGAPAVNADAMTKLDYLYKAWRNKTEQTATTMSVYDDAGTTVDHKSTVSDDGTTATRGEIVTGA